jgi:hypothetical protein
MRDCVCAELNVGTEAPNEQLQDDEGKSRGLLLHDNVPEGIPEGVAFIEELEGGGSGC